MTIATHALSEKDAAVVGQMREALKGVKGTVTGPHARPMFDDIMKGVAPADNIESEQGFVGGVPGMWVRPQSGMAITPSSICMGVLMSSAPPEPM